MTPDTEQTLLHLICAGHFEEFDRELEKQLGARNDSEADVRAITNFLEKALLEAKTRRSHFARDLEEMESARRFFRPAPTTSAVDFLA